MRRITSPISGVMLYGLGVTTARMLVGATSAIYLLSSGLTLTDLGVLKAIQAAIVFLADIPLGYVADKWGRSNVIRLSTAFSVIWLTLTAIGHYKVLFFAGEVFNALAIALYSGAFNALLMDAYKRQTGKDNYEQIIGKYNKWQFGLMAGASFGGSVLAPPDSRFVWWLAALIVFVHMVLLNQVLPKEESLQSTRYSVSGALRSVIDDFRSIHKVVFSRFSLSMLVSAYILLTFSYQVLIQFWQPIIGGEQLARYPGVFYGGTFLLILGAQWWAARRSEQNVSPRYLINSGLALSLILAVLAFFGLKLPVLSLILFMGLLFFLLRLVTITLYADFQRAQPATMWATAESILSALSRVLLLVLLPVLGGASQQRGVMVIPAVLLGASLLAFCSIIRFTRKG